MEPKNMAMTFEEWWTGDHPEKSDYGTWTNLARQTWNAARLGMIPAEGAIAVPDVGEWPTWAECAILCWSSEVDFRGASRLEFAGVRIVRPAPEWSPKVGVAVFAYNGGMPWIAVVESINDGVPFVRCSDGDKSNWSLGNIKPFSEKSIGKPWEEI